MSFIVRSITWRLYDEHASSIFVKTQYRRLKAGKAGQGVIETMNEDDTLAIGVHELLLFRPFAIVGDILPSCMSNRTSSHGVRLYGVLEKLEGNCESLATGTDLPMPGERLRV
jgi:hypothetical protein